MTGSTTVVSVASSGAAVATGAAVLPNTSGNSFVFSLALLAIVAGGIVLLSTVIAKIYKKLA